jgi:hypothetical protein
MENGFVKVVEMKCNLVKNKKLNTNGINQSSQKLTLPLADLKD